MVERKPFSSLKYSQGWLEDAPLHYLLDDDGHLMNNESCGTCYLNQAVLSKQTQIPPFSCTF